MNRAVLYGLETRPYRRDLPSNSKVGRFIPHIAVFSNPIGKDPWVQMPSTSFRAWLSALCHPTRVPVRCALLSAHAYRMLIASRFLLVTGCWLLIADC